MGWPRRRILCVFLLLLCDFIISVDAALFNYGTGTDDQVIEYSKESSALALIQAFPYFTEGQNDVFISPNGAISFGQGLDESTPSIESQGKSAIAVLYAPASDGTIYY
uniref:Uncharacterized protein n=1 Tax=Acrobeloides nanus TaxID=290746 RepID=A0A914CN15_9BILA